MLKKEDTKEKTNKIFTRERKQMPLFDKEKFSNGLNINYVVDKIQSKYIICSNCGVKLKANTKFCSECGSSVSEFAQQNATRQEEYSGKVLKCAHCGGTIDETTAICPECGTRITGRTAISSVQEFSNQLMEIEKSRKKGLGGLISSYMSKPDNADIQKLTLIRNFPIPNSIDDILEFMMLAIANIDVGLSKNTLSNRMNNSQVETSATMSKVISNAWVSKMEQCYRKAEIAFPKDPAFAGIQKMYFDKMKELKIRIK